MDLALEQFALTVKGSSSNVFNCRDLSKKVSLSGGQFLFKNNSLNRAVFLKLPMKSMEIQDNRRHIINKFETKIYFPFEKNLVRGGQTFFFQDKGFYEAIRQLSDDAYLVNDDDYNYDCFILRTLEEMPSLDPFLLKEKFRQKSINVDEAYFSFTKEAWNQIKVFVMQKFRPLIDFAYGDSPPSDKKCMQLTDTLWEANGDNPDIQRLFMAFGAPKEKIDNILYAWKGIMYYENSYTNQSVQTRKLLDWMDGFENVLGGVTPDIKEKRHQVRNYIDNNSRDTLKVLHGYIKSYNELFIYKRNASQFIDFLNGCSDSFVEISHTLSRTNIIMQIWKSFSVTLGKKNIDFAQARNILESFQKNMV
jgi:hypothetical protein